MHLKITYLAIHLLPICVHYLCCAACSYVRGMDNKENSEREDSKRRKTGVWISQFWCQVV